MKSRKFNQGRKLGFQQLESRMLMSGDVTVAVQHGALVVTGDNNDNQIEIHQVADGQYEVVGETTGFYGTTTVNGQLAPQTFSGVTGDFKIDLKGGYNSVAIGPQPGQSMTLPKNLKVNVSAGFDEVEVGNTTVTGGVAVNGKSAQATVQLEGCVIGSPNFNSGRNDCKINLSHGALLTADTSFERDVSFIGSGANELEMQTTSVGRDLSYKSKGDPSRGDSIELYHDSVSRNASFQTGDGNDQVEMIGLDVGGKLKILTGGGDDAVTLGGFDPNMSSVKEVPAPVTADQVFVDLGNGDDTLRIGGNDFWGFTGGGVAANKATYLGGDGVDRVINESGQDLFGSFSGFEIMPHKPLAPLPIVHVGPVALA
jgi:hypothetical protein